MKHNDTYQLYKGLQRPIVFKMLKGRFIYWGAGAIIAGVVIGGLIAATISNTIGMIAMFGVSGPAFFWVLQKQKQGLYSKTRNGGQLFIIEQKHFVRTKTVYHDKEEV